MTDADEERIALARQIAEQTRKLDREKIERDADKIFKEGR